MTTLNKPVTRRAENSRSYRGRRFVVQLAPGQNELIKIREEGTRTWHSVPLSKVFQLGARIAADAVRAERTAKRKLKTGRNN